MPRPPALSGPSLALNEVQRARAAFAQQYLVDLNPAAAAERVGMLPSEGHRLLANPAVRMVIHALTDFRARRVRVEQDYVLNRWLEVERADPRAISELWRVPCRYCWGFDHRYQYDDVELENARAAHRHAQLKLLEAERREFDDQGGGGYTINRDPMRGPDYVEFMERVGGRAEPNAEHTCPRCHGHGTELAYYHDSRTYGPDALALYRGVEVTRGGGFKVNVWSAEDARANIARHLGMFPTSGVTVRLPGGGSVEVTEVQHVIIDGERLLAPEDIPVVTIEQPPQEAVTESEAIEVEHVLAD